MLVPVFGGHPMLQGLFEWRSRLLQEHRREAQVGYEKALDEIRRRRGWALGRVRWLGGPDREPHDVSWEIPGIPVARNDQQSIGRWPLMRGPLWYLQLRASCGLGRTVYR
jgi:hypothetical protein